MIGHLRQIWLLVALMLALGTVGCYPNEGERQAYADMARSRVEIGDEREKVVQAFPDAWYHADCTWERGGGDYFLYGGHTRDTVIIVVIDYTNIGGKYVVDTIGVEDPPYWPRLNYCIPESVFER